MKIGKLPEFEKDHGFCVRRLIWDEIEQRGVLGHEWVGLGVVCRIACFRRRPWRRRAKGVP